MYTVRPVIQNLTLLSLWPFYILQVAKYQEFSGDYQVIANQITLALLFFKPIFDFRLAIHFRNKFLV